VNPELSYRQVIEIIKQTATDIGAVGEDAETGAGLVNLVAAVAAAKSVTPEDYKPAAFSTPTTWGGEGKVTAGERAAKSASFSGTVDSGADYATVYLGPNRQGSPSNPVQAMKDAGTRKGATLQFDRWEYDTVSPSIKYWYRIKGTSYWVADTAISGEPNVETLGSSTTTSTTGSSFNNANNLGVLSTKISGTKGSIHSTNTADYYKFRLDKKQKVDVSLYNLSANLDLDLYDENGSRITSSKRSGSSNESISKDLEPGYYYLKVSRSSSSDSSSYRLDLNAGTVTSQQPQNLQVSNFSGTVIATNGAMVYSGMSTANYVGNRKYGETVQFDAWARANTAMQYSGVTGVKSDDRWYRIQGTNQWIPAVFVEGQPGQLIDGQKISQGGNEKCEK
jgi:hypothetical protein